MRILLGIFLVAVAAAQPFKIPPLKTAVTIEGQPVEFTVWGSVADTPSGNVRLELTVDLGNFQENLTPILRAQLNQQDRCGARMSVEHASLAPSSPTAVLTANVHYERFGCAKAFGKEIVKRLAGGNAVVEVNLTPSIDANHIALAAQVRKIDADGSLSDVLNSGSFGDSIRDKIASSIESSIQKSANLKSALPAGMDDVAALQTVQFDDGGPGRLWLTLAGDVRLTADQFRDLAKRLPH